MVSSAWLHHQWMNRDMKAMRPFKESKIQTASDHNDENDGPSSCVPVSHLVPDDQFVIT